MSSTHNYRKHTHKNPIEKLLIGIFYWFLFREIKKINPEKILDAGCGEGFTLERLRKQKIGTVLEGLEHSQESIDLAKKTHPNLHITQGDIHKLPYKDNSFDLVICTEVLEHVPDPEIALRELVRVSSKYCLLTVPNEPFFMIGNFVRGKNVSRWGNDIEHINHWTFWGFKQFVGKYLTIQTLKLPTFWTLVLGNKK